MNEEEKSKLSIPHLRVLELLSQVGRLGGLSRSRLAERLERDTTYVSRVVGYKDPEKRQRFLETTYGKGIGIPLLDLGYVREVEIESDGYSMSLLQITNDGLKAYAEGKQRLKDYRTKLATRSNHAADCEE